MFYMNWLMIDPIFSISSYVVCPLLFMSSWFFTPLCVAISLSVFVGLLPNGILSYFLSLSIWLMYSQQLLSSFMGDWIELAHSGAEVFFLCNS